MTSTLDLGRTCWRIARADRFALIVDAADYFTTLRRAMIQARECILLIGWDFDTRVALTIDEDGEWPTTLGPFIDALVDRRPELDIHVLKWDLGLLQTLGRGTTPLFVLDWMTDERIHLQLDRVHPVGACHHQKIVVIDDAIAFCGGIDITVGRWDTRQHLDEDARRKSPWGFAQPPWHDATTAVDGEAARALGDLARLRWKQATGEDLTPPSRPSEDRWPGDLPATFTQVEVGVARSQPAHGDEGEAREIEAFLLAAIGRARRWIYIESQYFASDIVSRAIMERLREPRGPEIVIINPLTAEGWLEEQVMGSARSLILEQIDEADHADRFRIYYPVTANGTPIYVHAKILIVDDQILKVGSSNLNNRSMGLDTECDLVVEAAGAEGIERSIRDVRHDLLAEHLGTTASEVAAVEARKGESQVAMIEALRLVPGRTLVPLTPEPLAAAERALAANQALDPARPEPIGRHLGAVVSSTVDAVRLGVFGKDVPRS
ncbi:phospholipase D-like domain-containing protein [Methylobacterium iners]|uniref:Phospholipase D n=1 Tax=Methylobacterium iners TaxID=418707 RepID=A0ABQ4S0K1_9HYPH|nr:phospholipase D-like domain-containing protein [Methylobacterium iners]GJD95280.1 Cardiolipin synthase B [Methylobacterium iners]